VPSGKHLFDEIMVVGNGHGGVPYAALGYVYRWIDSAQVEFSAPDLAVTNISVAAPGVEILTLEVRDAQGGIVRCSAKIEIQPAQPARPRPDSFMYVANYGSDSVWVYDTATFLLTASIPTGNGPVAIAFSGDGAQAYVANQLDNSVTVIDSESSTAIATLAVGAAPIDIAIDSYARRAYVANSASPFVSAIDLETHVVSRISVGGAQRALALNRDGSRLYVAAASVGRVLVIDPSMSVPRRLALIPVGAVPSDLIFNSLFTHLYVANQQFPSVAVFDISRPNAPQSILASPRPARIALSAFSFMLATTEEVGTSVTIRNLIDQTSHRVGVGIDPRGVAFTSNGSRLVVANFGSDSATLIDMGAQYAARQLPTGFSPIDIAIFTPSIALPISTRIRNLQPRIGLPFRELSPDQEQRFFRGRLAFSSQFYAGDGAGPIKNGAPINASDDCPSDSQKIRPGQCGCGVPEIDTDYDGAADCIDACPNNAAIAILHAGMSC
jgi:YVTN family beta-propeller protein